MLKTALEISKLHCQPSGQPWVETCPGMDLGPGKNRKTKKHVGLANAHVLRADMVMYVARKDTCITMSMILLHRRTARTPDAAIYSAPCAQHEAKKKATPPAKAQTFRGDDFVIEQNYVLLAPSKHRCDHLRPVCRISPIYDLQMTSCCLHARAWK